MYPLCPLLRCKCLEARCAWWAQKDRTLTDAQGQRTLTFGDCTLTWTPTLLIELRDAISRLQGRATELPVKPQD
jgi:hypothetical protein